MKLIGDIICFTMALICLLVAILKPGELDGTRVILIALAVILSQIPGHG